jgi:hypothetical protein
MQLRLVLLAFALVPAVPLVAQDTRTESGIVFLATDLERPPRLHRTPVHYYPADQTTIHAKVSLIFIVDTVGNVESNSIKIVKAPDSAFAEAGRLTVLAQKYLAGVVNAKYVRTVTTYEVDFKPGHVSCQVVIESKAIRICADSGGSKH